MQTGWHNTGDFPRHDISGFVLAGGRSSRLGEDKVLLPWNGQTLLEHAVGRLQQVCGMVRVCGDRNDLRQHPGSFVSGTPGSDQWIHDAIPGAGPLGGIVAALEKTRMEWNFFLAVDLPLVPVALLRAIAARGETSHATDAGKLCIIPRAEGIPQPLCGMYHRSLAAGLRRALMEGKYKIMLAMRNALAEMESQPPWGTQPGLAPQGQLFGTAASRVGFFDAEDFVATAAKESRLSAGEYFVNINTPEDWRRARELGSGCPSPGR